MSWVDKKESTQDKTVCIYTVYMHVWYGKYIFDCMYFMVINDMWLCVVGLWCTLIQDIHIWKLIYSYIRYSSYYTTKYRTSGNFRRHSIKTIIVIKKRKKSFTHYLIWRPLQTSSTPHWLTFHVNPSNTSPVYIWDTDFVIPLPADDLWALGHQRA